MHEKPQAPREALPDETLGLAILCLAVGAMLGLAFCGPLHSLSAAVPAVGDTVPSPSEAANEFLSSLESIATIVGIFAAAYWFYRRRARYPRLTWSHTITHERINDETIWLNVQISVENKGEIQAKTPSVTTRVHQVLPLHSDVPASIDPNDKSLFLNGEICWPEIRSWDATSTQQDIEPTETTTLERDFLIPANLEVILVYTFVPNAFRMSTGHGWPIQTIYRIADSPLQGGQGDAEERPTEPRAGEG